MGHKMLSLIVALVILVPAVALARTAAPAGAKAYIISPAAGEMVTSPVTVKFGLHGMGVAPAGIAKDKTGHHHLIIDRPLPPLDKLIPKNTHHIHFGGGQTEGVIELSPGQHTLQLILGDKGHVPFDPPIVSDKIAIIVK